MAPALNPPMLAIVKISLRHVYRDPARVGALSGGAIIGTIMVILIVLAVIVYGVNTTATDTANTATSAPLTSGSPAPSGIK